VNGVETRKDVGGSAVSCDVLCGRVHHSLDHNSEIGHGSRDEPVCVCGLH